MIISIKKIYDSYHSLNLNRILLKLIFPAYAFISTRLDDSTIRTEAAVFDSRKFLNPLFSGDYPDPSIMRDGKDYYMTHSSFDYIPGLTVWHSTDLVNGEPISNGLTTYMGPCWAPDILTKNNQLKNPLLFR